MEAVSPAPTLPPSSAPVFPPAPPPQARRLAMAGLLPLLLGVVVIWLVYPYPDAHAFVTVGFAGYAAAIVAFLGGVHWGLAMRAGAHEPTHYVWACVPPCVAAFGLLMPAHAGLVVLGVMLLVCYAVDRRLYLEHGLGGWLTLRFRLSALAALCCFIAAAGS
jgi:Protein of unknown function (DUF3429)